MNKKILYIGLAIFAIAVVGIVCMNCVHSADYSVKVVKVKTFKSTYVTYNDGGMINQANAKGAKKVLKTRFDENYKYGLNKGLKKAIKFYNTDGYKVILKVKKIKTGYNKHKMKYYKYKVVAKVYY